MLRKLLWNKITDQTHKTMLIVWGLFLAMLCTSMLWIIYTNIERFLLDQSHSVIYTHTVEVTRKESRWFLIGKQNNAETDIQKKLVALVDNPAFTKAYVFYNFSIPVSAKISIASKDIITDMFIFVLSDNFFADKGIVIDTPTIPIALSKTILTLYNTQIANTTLFPEIPEWLLWFMDIMITFGKSEFFGFSGKTLDRNAKIQTVDPILPIGFIIPYSAAKDVIHDIGRWSMTPYKVVGFLRDGADLETIRTAYSKDFTIVTDAEKIQHVHDQLTGVIYFFQWLTGIIIAILIVFLVYITYSVVEHNKKIFQTLRLHGASDMHILRVLWMEIVMYGCIGVTFYGLGIAVIDIRALPGLSVIVQHQMHTAFVVQNLSIRSLLSIGIGYMLLFLLLWTIFSYREWSKKFENR